MRVLATSTLGILVRSSAANLMLPLTASITAPLLARALGTGDRGVFAGLSTPVVLIAVVGTVGFQDAITYYLGTMRVVRGFATYMIAHYRLLLLGWNCILIAVFGSLTALSGLSVGTAVAFLIAAVPFAVGSSLLQGFAVGMGWLDLVNGNRMCVALLRVALLGLLFVLGELTLYSALLATVLVYAGSFLLTLYRVRQRVPIVEDNERVSSPKGSEGQFLRLALKYLVGASLAISLSRIDQSISLPLVGSSQLGYYAVAVAIADIPMAIVSAIRLHYMSVYVQPGEAGRMQIRAVVLAIAWGVAAAVVGILLAPILIPAVFGPDFSAAILPTQLLLAGTPFASAMVVASGLLIRFGGAGEQMLLNLTALVAGVVSLFLLAPAFGATGLSWASDIAYLAGFAVYGLKLLLNGRLGHRLGKDAV